MRTLLIAAVLAVALPGCDIIQQQMGIEDPAAKAAKTDAEKARAVELTTRCRRSGRAIEGLLRDLLIRYPGVNHERTATWTTMCARTEAGKRWNPSFRQPRRHKEAFSSGHH